MKLTNLDIFNRKPKTLYASKHSGQKTHLFKNKYFIGLLISLASITGCGDKVAVDQKSVARHIKQSQAYLSQGQFRAANIEARNAIQKNPDNIQGHIVLADILNELGRYKKSIELLELLPEAANQNNAFLYTLLKAYMGRGKYISAAELLQKNAVSMRQQQADYSLALAALYEAQDNLTDAEDIYHQLLNQSPDSINALLGLIRIKYQQADLYSAEGLISRAQFIAPHNPDIDFIKAKISIDKKQYGEAEMLLTEAISNLPNADVMTPRKSAFLQLLSETLTIEGKTTEAIIYTQKIAEAFPGAEIAQGDFRDASVLFEQGEFQQAETLLEKLVAEYPNFEDASVLLGIIKYRAGDINSASNYFNQHIDAEISNPAVTKLAAIASLRNNQPERVLAMLGQYRHSHNDPQILILFGQAALSLQQTAKAESALKRAISLDPSIAEAYLTLADLYNSESPPNRDLALAILEDGYHKNADHFKLAAAIARQLFFVGSIDKAKAFINQLLNSESNEAAALQLAGDFFYSQQQLTQASDYYHQALAINPLDYDSAMKLAFIAGDTLSYTEQLDALKAASLIRSDKIQPLQNMLAAANTAAEVKQAEKMINTLANENNPSNGFAVLARFYATRGQLDIARSYQEKLHNGVSKTAPNSALINSVALAIHYEDAQQNISKGNIEAARKSAMAGLMIDPRSALFLILLTEMEMQSEHYLEAQKLVDQIKVNNLLLGEELQGDLYREKNNFPAAIETYQALWQQNATNALGSKIYTLLNARNNESASLFLSEWKNRIPNSTDVLSAQANDYLLAEDYKKAVVILEQIDQREPNSAINLNNLAWSYQQLSHPAALATAKRAYQLAPDYASIVDTYGWLLFAHKQFNEAVAVLQQAVDLEPNNSVIAEHLKDAQTARSQ